MKTIISPTPDKQDRDPLLELAIAQDEPLPLSAFKGLCSRANFYNRYFPNGLNSERIDGRRCVRPSDFFKIRKLLTTHSLMERK